jgi:tight adherence protein B
VTEARPAAATAAVVLMAVAALMMLSTGRLLVPGRLGLRTRRIPAPGRVRYLVGRCGGVLPRVLMVTAAAATGLSFGGLVAALYTVVYTELVTRAMDRVRRAHAEKRASAAVDDLVAGLAADLRAGLPASTALGMGVGALVSAENQVVGQRTAFPRGMVPATRPGDAAVSRGGARRGAAPDGDITGRPDQTRRAGARRPHVPTRDGPGWATPWRVPAPTVDSTSVGAALMPVAIAARTGDDVPGRLRGVSLPGTGEALERLAAAWQVSDSSGAPLADVLERLDADLAARRRRRVSAAAELGTATATVRLLALLPLLGLGLGYALGADPVHVLLHTGVGAVCAVTALALQVVGLWWAERIMTPSARRAPPCPARG